MCRKLIIAFLFLLALPARGQAQDLRILEALFRQINSFTIAMHGGDLIGTSELDARCGAFGLCGMGTEVFINLHDTETLLLELALGTSYLQGFTSREETLDFRGAIRSVPTIAIYMTSRNPGGQEWVHPFIGASFGLTELWNAQAYDPEGTRYGLRGSTYDQGVLAGVSINIGPISGLFLETSYRRRRFFSVEWTFPAGVQRVPEGWPRELNLNSWLVSVGWQFDIPNPAGR